MLKIACIGQQCSGKTSLANFFIKKFSQVFHIKMADPIYNALDGLKQKKHRAFMQQFGDLAKLHFGEEIFPQILEKQVVEIEKHDDEIAEHEFLDQILIINDDIRFAYELKYVRKMGFKLCSIICPAEVRASRAQAQGFDFIENHASETEIPSLLYKADFVITRGEMSMEELGNTADEILEKIRVQG